MASEGDGSRLDRELDELLQELRVVLPGIQVLFAFLLTVPFAQRFATVDDFQETTYFVALVATALASVFLISPSVQHRLRWRDHDKEFLLRSANRHVLTGIVLLGIAIEAVVLLVGDFLYGRAAGVAVAGVVGVVMVVVWWLAPVSRSLRTPRRRPHSRRAGRGLGDSRSERPPALG